jgi:hypothetical protein
MYAARFDATGGLVCAAHVAGLGWDQPYGVLEQADTTFLTIGTLQQAATFAPDTPWEIRVTTVFGEDNDGFLATWSF